MSIFVYSPSQIKMKKSDDDETQRCGARNNLEEFIYETRDSLPTSDGLEFDDLIEYFRETLDSYEKWICGEGNDSSRETFEQIRQALVDFNFQESVERSDYEAYDDFSVVIDKINTIIGSETTSDLIELIEVDE